MLNASLNIRKSLLSYDDDESRREIATTKNNIGRVHYMLGSPLTSLGTYVEAYSLPKELLPPDHLDLAASAYNLGQTHHQYLSFLDIASPLCRLEKSFADLVSSFAQYHCSPSHTASSAMTLYTEFYEIVSKRPCHRDVAIILKCMALRKSDDNQGGAWRVPSDGLHAQQNCQHVLREFGFRRRQPSLRGGSGGGTGRAKERPSEHRGHADKYRAEPQALREPFRGVRDVHDGV